MSVEEMSISMFHILCYSAVVRGILELLHYSVNLDFPTFFVKVRAHRGEPYNEASDHIVSTATLHEDVPLLWNTPSCRIIYQFTPYPCE